ncbi:MAG TPA: hypothetical protein VKX41_17055 [Alloacidobacterium sp.]|jgi:ribosomal protein L30E|nr:hypothetical protein [Alloacidobacterium sp.]
MTQSLTKKELKVLIANARTPEDHRRIAAHYRAEGEQLKAKQRENEAELGRIPQKPFEPPCAEVADHGLALPPVHLYHEKAAEKAFAMAAQHE